MEASFRWATPDDRDLPTYDNTKLQGMNTCPVFGVLRYQMHRVFGSSGRAMALEAGSAMHDVFAWVRLCTLAQHAGKEAFNHHGLRIYGRDRWDQIHTVLPATDDIIDHAKSGALAVLDSSGFYDDPRDKRRTLANLEECAYAYIDRWDWDTPIWQRDPNDPMSECGIEIPFDIVVSLTNVRITKKFRFTGKIDGIHHGNRGVRVHENKTASRLSDAWSMSFHVAAQVTGYCLAASVFTGDAIRDAVVYGLAIPLPKSYDYGGYYRDVYSRTDDQFTRWLTWVDHTIDLYDAHRDDPFNAPQYTHSCNRYFRPCMYIPFCSSSTDDQREMFKDMDVSEWSPLHDKFGMLEHE